MNERQLIEAFDGSIDCLAAGQTVEDCLRAYPHLADELRSLLETGQAVSRARVSAAELRHVRLRVDPQVISLIEETDFKSSRFRPAQGRMVLLVAIALLILIGVMLFLRRVEGEQQFADQTTPTLATESPITPARSETTVVPEATESPSETLTPTAAPTDTPLPTRTPSELQSPQQSVDVNDTVPIDNTDDGAVGNQDDGASGNRNDGAVENQDNGADGNQNDGNSGN